MHLYTNLFDLVKFWPKLPILPQISENLKTHKTKKKPNNKTKKQNNKKQTKSKQTNKKKPDSSKYQILLSSFYKR